MIKTNLSLIILQMIKYNNQKVNLRGQMSQNIGPGIRQFGIFIQVAYTFGNCLYTLVYNSLDMRQVGILLMCIH